MIQGVLRRRVLLALVIVAASIFIFRFSTIGEFSYNVDETAHANTGVYVASLLRDHPFLHPLQYTYTYYGHYPSLGLITWPPLFYLVEGIMFFTFGPAVLVARISVALFAFLALYFWFRFMAELHGELVAAAATLVLALAPMILLFEKVVMLEIPALAFSIAAIYYWHKYLGREQTRDLYLFAVFAAAGLLTKQTAMFLAPLCLFSILASRKWRLLYSAAMIRAFALVAILIAPFYAVVFRLSLHSVRATVLDRADGWNPFLYYLHELPTQLGWPLLLLSLFGIVTCWMWAKRQTAILMLSWIAACYLTFSLIIHHEPRYTIYWIPAFVYFAIGPVTAQGSRVFRLASQLAVLGVSASLLFSAWSYRPPYVEGYARVADRIVQFEHSGVILFDGPLAGDFIFYLRRLDPHEQFVVLRKSLYVGDIVDKYGSVELLHNSSDVLQLIKRYGIRFILVCDNCSTVYPVQQNLRDLLRSKSDQFVLVDKFRIDSNQPVWRNREIALYENIKRTAPTQNYVHIKMLTLPFDIVFPLSR